MSEHIKSERLMSEHSLAKADRIWINANLMTFEGDAPYGVVTDGIIASHQGKISFIGQMKAIDLNTDLNKNAEIHDLNGQWLSPGLIDCHTHIIYGGNRSKEFELRLTGVSYEAIAKQGGGILSTVKATREASHEALALSALNRIEHLLNEGVTSLEIKSGYGLDTENEIKMLEVAKQLEQQLPLDIYPTFLGAHALPPEFKDNAQGYIQLICEEMLPLVSSKQLAVAVDAFCENIGFTRQQTRQVFETAQKLGLPVKLHAEQLSDQNGTQLAAEFKALSVDHLEYVSEDGVKAIAESGTVAVLLPGAFYYLRETKQPPIDLFRQYQVPIAIATDSNPGSSPCTSLLLMANMACTFFKMTPEEALRGITIHAAQALGIERQVGSLALGKQADFAIWNINAPADLAYAFGHNPCVGVIKNGEWVLDKLS
jgi:imidazolonepropionase